MIAFDIYNLLAIILANIYIYFTSVTTALSLLLVIIVYIVGLNRVRNNGIIFSQGNNGMQLSVIAKIASISYKLFIYRLFIITVV